MGCAHTRSRIEKYCTYKFLDEKTEGNKTTQETKKLMGAGN
jgi:hypothetical protein